MKIISLHVKNYRVIGNVSVEFDSQRTLIGAPNGTGKSTLVEAMHRALFLRSKTGGKVQESMRSKHSGGHPEVTMKFHAAGAEWTLEKRFSGASGFTRLHAAGSSPLQGDDAEQRLAELLQNENGAKKGKQVEGQWSHLWVWQGSAGNDPTLHASEHRDTLLKRLQQDGLATLMESPVDQAVRKGINEAYNTTFTDKGKARAKSRLEEATGLLADAEAVLQKCMETAARLEDAALAHAAAETRINEVHAVLPLLREQLAEVLSGVDEARALRLKEQDVLKQHRGATEILEKLRADHATIKALKEQVSALTVKMEPAAASQVLLEKDSADALKLYQEATQVHRTQEEQVLGHQRLHDLLTAHQAVQERRDVFATAQEHADECAVIRKKQDEVEKELSQLGGVSTPLVDTWRKLDRELSHAVAMKDAVAARLEVIESDSTVSLGGNPLVQGDVRDFTDTTDLTLGTRVKIRLHPGGGASTQLMRTKVEDLQNKLRNQLEAAGCRSLEQAEAALERRRMLEQENKHLGERWRSAGGERADARCRDARIALESAQAELNKRAEMVSAEQQSVCASADSPESIRAAVLSARTALDEAQSQATRTRLAVEQQQGKTEQAQAAVAQHQEQFAQHRQELQRLETTLQTRQELAGSDLARVEGISAAEQKCAAWKGDLEQIVKALELLNPTQLDSDAARLSRAISQQEDLRKDAETRLAVARSQLVSDGSLDPQAEVLQTRARAERAREAYRVENQRAESLRLLYEMFTATSASMGRSLTEPLAGRITGYLQCVLGSGVEARLHLPSGEVPGLEIIDTHGVPFEFEALSGGEKEQVGAAVRLAMAEVLAADHAGTLPVVFDDAFAYADPRRVQSLQRMLDMAANRGLQIIVLTCNPVDYTALGAREVRLTSAAAPADVR